MKYSELGLKQNTDVNILKIQDKQIEVLQYLPVKDKIDLIDITLQNAEENGIYNEIKLDIYFGLYIIYMYTNLEFTDEEKANPEILYDELESNHIITDVIQALDYNEYENLRDCLKMMKAIKTEYNKSAAALLRSFIQDLPKNAEAASEIVNNFDKDKYKEVVQFAQAANGNRPF